MPIHESSLWSFTLPDGWEVESDDDAVTCFDPDGPGALQLSALRHDQPIDDKFLRHLAAEHLDAGAQTAKAECGEFSGFELGYDDDEQFWREWYLRAGPVVLFVTYNCPLAAEGQEEGAVDAILDSLQVRSG